ncbi:MAG: amidohydrolase 2 [Bryobacterales bacterium]|nr:amidohydrolase 2 [Bryobacterales bacterium]
MARFVILGVSRRFLILVCCLGVCWSQHVQPKLIDCHVHHNGSKDFLEKLVLKLDSLQGMAMLIVEPGDLKAAADSIKSRPDRLVGLGQIELDAPNALETIDQFHAAGFRGLGEITKPEYSYDDRRYWPLYERAEKYGMIILFHTGIVNRNNPEVPVNVSSDRMRVSTIDLIARRFPKLTIIGAHLGNPDYAWAGEVGRWNPNVYFDVSGSTLIKKQEDYPFFKSIFWWTSVASAHTPKSNAPAFEKLVFGSDVFEGDLGELDRELERYHRMLDACGVAPEVQANIFSGTLWRMLNR